jgi:hypothetical protein
MRSADLLTDAFGRVSELVHQVTADLTPEQLVSRLDGHPNTIAWLIWHLTRVQDSHIADAAGTQQIWVSEGWAERFALPFDRTATGYGQKPEEVAAVKVDSPSLLTGYYDAVHTRTVEFVDRLTDDDLARVVDESWDPPVTLGARLVSVISDDLQHAGQAAFVRGAL